MDMAAPALDGRRRVFSKSEYAYREVREMILNGDLGPGATINQELLAAQLGVSTTPLREALRRLEAEGLVLLAVHQDAVVAPLDMEEARQIFETRIVLDGLAVELAAKRHSEAQAAEIRDAGGLLRPFVEIDPVEALALNRRFHRAIYWSAGNPILSRTLDGLWDRSDRYRRFGTKRVLSSDAPRDDHHAEHLELMELVLARKAAAAARLMRAHVEDSRESVLLTIKQGIGGP